VAIYLDRPAVIPEIAENAAALIGHFGASDEALLDLVFGKAQPAGKLPFEMPSSMEAVEAQKEDVPLDSKDPLFKFGHGLTFSEPEN
jgi:beta-glucosidase